MEWIVTAYNLTISLPAMGGFLFAMITYCCRCGDVLLAGDPVIPAERGFHGEMHAECYELWAEDYYPMDAPWERWWWEYLEEINGDLTTPNGCVIIPAEPRSNNPWEPF